MWQKGHTREAQLFSVDSSRRHVKLLQSSFVDVRLTARELKAIKRPM
jgi:hypothetical protein